MNEIEAGEMSAGQGGDGGKSDALAGYSVVINCYQDGTHDVFQKPLEPATEEDHPDGMFGLDSIEDALRAVIAIKRDAPDYSSAEEDEMMQGYAGGGDDAEGVGD